jgi:hypothetical protein
MQVSTLALQMQCMPSCTFNLTFPWTSPRPAHLISSHNDSPCVFIVVVWHCRSHAALLVGAPVSPVRAHRYQSVPSQHANLLNRGPPEGRPGRRPSRMDRWMQGHTSLEAWCVKLSIPLRPASFSAVDAMAQAARDCLPAVADPTLIFDDDSASNPSPLPSRWLW